MASETDTEASKALAVAFEESAISMAAAPIWINRFLLIPSDRDHGVLVLGGAGIGKRADGGSTPFVRPVAAFTFAKHVAEDLMLHLEKVFQVTSDDRKRAIERNKHLGLSQ